MSYACPMKKHPQSSTSEVNLTSSESTSPFHTPTILQYSVLASSIKKG
eukprot:CAMPEP_0201611334 /NCGR_PEP_ID=MMETSP0492-20130828/19798_1 /ASSEMBLY_ACC=CAM_ASM_000837 /TAXON_ID=420259 /ORGANISM="Thalassiosira gravida, Strain GMp14c1" /LENGTH=47 /DNA_ID= /DNA_START= /DNA_END= /DNA_ORIENTATION=